jgi:hypothetical protein
VSPGDLDAATVADLLGLQTLEVEGGRFRQTWSGPSDASGRPVGTAIYALFEAGDPWGFSAMHRLDATEIWHHYLGDPFDLLLLDPAGEARTVRVGRDLLAGELPQVVIGAGVWLGGSVAPGGRWTLVGTTMAPGFVSGAYHGGERGPLMAAYPQAAGRIAELTRPGLAHGQPQER